MYQVVAARRQNFDSLLWQVPALSLTAQAFLLVIALGSGSGHLARIAAGLLSAVTALMSVQLCCGNDFTSWLMPGGCTTLRSPAAGSKSTGMPRTEWPRPGCDREDWPRGLLPGYGSSGGVGSPVTKPRAKARRPCRQGRS